MLRIKTMPIVSKYDAKTQQQLLDEVMDVLSQHNTPKDLALMTLGNAVTNIISANYQPEDAYKVAEQFGKVLLQSMEKQA
ncbi:DUF1414 domain-containing protein [Pseudidiomarina sp.]|uniref:DUF1414 domain-containing protein n=1 Tax=Pseudidiomarina sp. TaxID=2081707 RepID=UPI003A9790C4